MDLLAIVVAGFVLILGVAVSLIGNIISAELHESSPTMARWIINNAVAHLPEQFRERYQEEWYAHINECPGKLAKLWHAVSIRLSCAKLNAQLSINLRMSPEIPEELEPIDLVERLATRLDWSFDRPGEDEIAISVAGQYTDYFISFTWMDDIEVLHLACAFDFNPPASRRGEVRSLVSQVNEQLWLGHFDFWKKDNIVMYRHALLLPKGTKASGMQCEILVASAVEICERYFPVFQTVAESRARAKEALDTVQR